MQLALPLEQKMPTTKAQPIKILLPDNVWKILQTTLWLIGVTIVFFLIFKPAIGITLFWNLLIPIAPAILVLIPGVWRNICPMSTTALLPRKLKIAKPRKLSLEHQGKLYLLGVIALLLIVPFRHLLLNTNGMATAIMLVGATAIAITMGMFFEWRSGWCATACPIHSVERMYGGTPLLTTDNAHCKSCQQCVSLCPDATQKMSINLTRNIAPERFAAKIMTGGFVGYIWGWCHVPDYTLPFSFEQVITTYAWPFIAGAFSLFIYLMIKSRLNNKQAQLLNQLFVVAAVSCYYWYRIPSLFGVGLFPNDGVLIDLSASLPSWFAIASQLTTTAFFIWFMLIRPKSKPKQSWSIRPAYAISVKNI